MSPSPTYAALRRYLTGQSDPAERRMVEAWAAESPEHHAYLAALGREWQRIENSGTDADRQAADDAWTVLAGKLDLPADVPPTLSPRDQPAIEIQVRQRPPARVLTGAFEPRRRRTMVRATVAAVILLATGLYFLDQRSRQAPVAEQAGPMREVATGAGQRAEIKLGDGSTVVLGVKSRLRFRADFAARSRELTLEGQAYFQVAHDSARPFTVHAAGSRTVDIGTAFVVRAYSGDNQVQVVVTEGSVAFGAAGTDARAPTVLTEARMGRLAKGDTVPQVTTVDPSRYTDWLQGRLTFDNTPLSEVAAELGRWHDADVRLADSTLAGETFTASFGSESFSEALATLTTVLQLRVERRGTVVLLHRRAR